MRFCRAEMGLVRCLVRPRLDLLLLLLFSAELVGSGLAARNPQPVERHLEPSGSCTGIFDLFGAFHAFRGVLSKR